MSLVLPFRGRPEGISRVSKGKRVIECGIENFVRMVIVMKQRVVPPGVFSFATGYCER